MKTLFYKLSVVVAAMTLAISCMVTSVPQKLDRFVDKAELKSASYTSADWKRSISEYDKLADKYAATKEEYSPEEQEMAARAMGRYHSLLLKNGIEVSKSYLDKLKEVLPSYIEGLTEGFGKGAESLEKTLEELLSDEKLEKSLESLGQQIEKIASDEKLGKTLEEFGKKLENILESEELEKSLEGIGKKLEELFGGFTAEESEGEPVR